MFTGIVEFEGQVVSASSESLKVGVKDDPKDWKIGESVAVNGCCLTVVSTDGGLRFDLSPETLARTSLGDLKTGDLVNLERAMRADGRFGGHIVQGHVDATGQVVSKAAQGNATVMGLQAPEEFARYLIDKGSITVDGISLTVVAPKNGAFEAWIIPHTLESTNLRARKPGDRVNLEFDVLARYVEKLLGSGGG